MAKEKVTIQDIADALGISRNTASKALNDSGNIPDETRNRVIKKAIELKYKQFAYMENEHVLTKAPNNIALLTENLPNTSHFGSMLISGLEKRISAEGYNLSIHIVREVDQDSLTLPNNFDISNVDGIICIELFNLKYTQLITDLGIPTIFIDCASDICYPEFHADLLLMENEHSTYQLTRKLIESGYNHVGFAGDYNHCKSFNERWVGYQRAMLEARLQVDPSHCIVDDDRLFFSKPGWLNERVAELKSLPDAYVCANDFIAVDLIRALRARNVKVPQDIVICGFDNAPESRIIEPALTTVHIYSNEMGIKAAEMLLSRIDHPSQPYQVSHIVTKPIIRESTPTLMKANPQTV
ncbi:MULTISPECIES: LacI family DNA-binding transcriptional regulator [unclassified Paenibacillus]|uniref:LacI family DNA-binding transcriptional regulator n=1 Tax=unclassified Paenibacillus TaxID=185978 RepID=UPI0008D40B0B|nr:MULTISPECIES: LacI family DNA-binding transcriptional regulator [unclassified Paenibacillus]QLG37992.1 LacI family DNA-binding transcriptional regulator [Paenibacillus sp. E222]SEO58583.1 transcriptional regulator, LacI family [Paenibacillus sp. OK076]